MVKLAKNVKNQPKQKKMAPPPPKEVDDSEEDSSEEEEEEEESSEEEMLPVKKAAPPAKAANKKAATPAKKAVATPAKKVVATPAKKVAVTPAKKTPVPGKGAKNGKNAKKEESDEEEEEDEEEDEEDDSEEEEDESEPELPVPVKKPAAQAAAKKPAAQAAVKKQDSEDEEDDEEDDEDDEEEDDSEEEPMDTTPAKGKKAIPAKAVPVKAAAGESEDDEDEDDDDDDEEDDEEEDDDEEETVQETPGKRKKEMAKQKGTPDAKKKKTEETAFSLFMGNLNANKDFEELKTAIRNFFAKKDLQVQEVRIGNSKKFGYVDFSSEAELDKALKLNGKKLMGLEMKLERAKSKESLKENKKERAARTIFVKNLAYSVTQEDLQGIFEEAMEIRLVSKDGSSKGIAYIEFKSEADAEKAMEEKQGMELEGRSLILDYTREKGQMDGGWKGAKGAQPGGESRTLVVNNLSYDATEEALQEVFEKASAIRIPQNNQGRAKGYAFVDFPTADDAKEALSSCNNTEIEGRTIRLEFSTPGGQNRSFNARGGFGQQSKTLFVKGLSEDTTEETLRESFDGSIGARIVTDRDTGSSKGFGFVDFSSPEDAKAAKEAMEDGEIDGNKVTLDFAKPKGDGPRGGGGFGRGGRGGRGGGRGGFGGRGGRGFGGRGGGFRGGRGGGGDHKPQGKKIKFDD